MAKTEIYYTDKELGHIRGESNDGWSGFGLSFNKIRVRNKCVMFFSDGCYVMKLRSKDIEKQKQQFINMGMIKL